MKVGRTIASLLESRYFVLGIASLGVILRLALIHLTSAHSGNTFKDEDDYESIGASLSHGGPYSIDGIHLSGFRAPAEPLLIAIVFRLFGPHLSHVKLVEALLLAAVPFACSFMGRSLGLSAAAANAGAAIAGLHPAIAYASTTIYPTALTAVALTLGLLFSLLVFNGRGKGAAAGAGLAFGLAASATTTFAPVAVLAALIMAFKRHYSAAVIVAVLGTLPVLAWMVRNQVELGEFTVATNGGINLFLGANDFSTPMSGNNVPGRILYPLPSYEEVFLDRVYKVEAADWIKAHPVRWGKLVLLRGLFVFDSVGNPATQGLNSGLAARAIGWIMLPVVLLSLFGLASSHRLPLAWLTIAMLLPVILSSSLTMTKPRFRLPCDPALGIFSVVGFTTIRRRIKEQRTDAALMRVKVDGEPT